MSDAVVVRFEYKNADLKAVSAEMKGMKSDRRAKNRREWVTFIVLSIPIACLGVVVGGQVLPIVLVQICTVFAFMGIFVKSSSLSDWAGVWEYQFSEDSVLCRRKSVEHRIPWTYFTGFSETDKHIFLWKDDSPVIIPKSAIGVQADLDRLLEMVTGKLKPAVKLRFQFSLRTAIAAMVLAAVGLGAVILHFQGSVTSRELIVVIVFLISFGFFLRVVSS
jgi:hypothetical protein